MGTVGEILSKLDFETVFGEFQKYHTEDRARVLAVFQKLKAAKPAANDSRMVLFIRAMKENADGEDEVIESVDPDDRDVFFDVCGTDDDYDGLYSVASSSYEELLGFFISEETLAKYRPPQIAAHILWELDW